MKQAEDKYTADMFGPTREKPLYRAHLATTDGNVLIWTNLTLAQAKAFNKMCEKHYSRHSSTELARYGWAETK